MSKKYSIMIETDNIDIADFIVEEMEILMGDFDEELIELTLEVNPDVQSSDMA